MNVEKRDGTIQPFNFSKIERAVKLVFESKPVCEEVPDKFIDQLKSYFEDLEAKVKNPTYAMPIEEIQDIIRDFLIKKNKIKAAESFILYRKKREEIREKKSWLNKEITRKLKGNDVENQNANLDEASFGGRMGEANRVVTKNYALKYVVSKMARDNHNKNMIYIHDLDSYVVGMHNCLSIPFDYLLEHGFTVRQTDVRPASSVNTACQLTAVIFQLQSLQQFGGVSATHIDWTMVPYIRKSFTKHLGDGMIYCEGKSEYKIERFHKWLEHDKNHPDGTIHFDDVEFKELHPLAWEFAMDMTEREVYQGVEGLYHNLNTLQSRSGNQLPFTSINYGTCTLEEGRMFTKALLDVSIRGLGKFGRTSIFPCGIFQYMKGVNDKPGTPNYDLKRLALKSTSKRLYPNYANVDWSGNAGYDRNDPRTYFSTMGCRTANGWDINGFGQLKDGRGNICPVTIILPTLAMMAKSKEGDIVENFMNILDRKIWEAKEMLLERFKYIASQPAASAKFMYDNNTMAGYIPEEGIISALKHGTLALGQLGLAETLQILIGTDHTTDVGMKLAKKIEGLFKERCASYKEQYRLNFGVYYTPAENLCYTAFKKWKEQFGDYPEVTYYTDKEGNRHDKLYFTNSMHVPVYKNMTAFKKIETEAQLTGYSSAGCITYVEVKHEVLHNTDAIEEMVDYAMEHDIPYFALNRESDQCMKCGYQGHIDEVCPKCGSTEIEHLARVTGYLTGDYPTAFNDGKISEKEDRVKHSEEIDLTQECHE